MRNNPQTPRASRPVHRLAPTQEHGLGHGEVTGTCAIEPSKQGPKSASRTAEPAQTSGAVKLINVIRMAIPALLLRLLLPKSRLLPTPPRKRPDLCLPRPSAAPQTAPTADTRAPQQLASSAAIMLENAAKRTGEVSEVDGGEDAVH